MWYEISHRLPLLTTLQDAWSDSDLTDDDEEDEDEWIGLPISDV